MPTQQIGTQLILCQPQIREHFSEESLAGLSRSIKEVGVLQPMLVRRVGEQYVVLDGERRFRAAKMAGLERVPVIVVDGELSAGEIIQRQLVANCQREDLTPIEKARAIERLTREAGWSASQAAAKLGLSPAMVSKLLTLLLLPQELQEQVDSGKVPLSSAYELAKLPDSADREHLANEVACGRLSRERLIAATKSRPAKPAEGTPRKRTKRAVQRVSLPLGGGRSVAVAGPGLTLQSLIEWLESLVERAKSARAHGMEFAEAVKSLRAAAKQAEGKA